MGAGSPPGRYIQEQTGADMLMWNGACIVHDEFKGLESIARAKGFLMVSASPLTRSSYHAGEDFARLRAARAASSSAAP